MVLIAFAVTGGISLMKLPVSLLPASDYPSLSVLIEYPGITPAKIETVITRPVERILKTIGGITEISSESEDGRSRINLTFADDIDIRIAALSVREKIELIRDSFPEEVQEPVVMRYDPSDRPVIIAAIEIEGLALAEVRDYAERRIKPALKRIEGVSEINIAGGDMKEIHVEADRSLLEGRGLSLGNIASGISAGNISLPCGVVESSGGNMVLYLPGRYRHPDDIKDVSVSSADGKIIYVRDVAVVGFSPREKGDLSRYNGKEMVIIYLHKGSSANTLNVCKDAGKILTSFDNIKTTCIYNQGEYVESSVSNAAVSGLWGIVIVAVVLSVFYRRRENVLPVVLSIPASIIIVPFFLHAGGSGINIMTLSGFALGAGVVVSSGIIIMETIIPIGNREDNVAGAVKSVKNAVVSSTLTNMVVFLPLIFLNSKSGSMYSDMAYTVVWALIVSLFASLVLVPSFYISFSRIIKKNTTSADYGLAASYIRKFYTFIDSMEIKMNNCYSSILDYSFNRRGKIAASAALIFFISMALFTFIKNDNIADGGGDEFYIYLEFPTGFSLDATDRGVRDAEQALNGLPGIKSVSAKTEKWRGTLTVKPEHKPGASNMREFRQSIKNSCNDVLKKHGGFAYISEADEIASREITVHFTGDDIDVLKKISREAASLIDKIEGVSECLLRFRDGRPEYILAVDKEKASSAGVSHASLSEGLRNGLFGPVITKVIDNDREIDVRVRLKKEDRDDIDSIIAGKVISENGAMISYSSLINVAESSGITRIHRLNGRRSCSVTAVLGSLSSQEGEYRIRKALQSVRFPDEYSYEFDRRLKEYNEERRELIVSIVLSVILIYMILAAQFESLTLPIFIMISIPFAACGIAPFLLITGTPLSPPVYLGIIVLSGIAVNNGIILLDAINAGLSGISSMEEITGFIKESSINKFRPVFITTITVVLSMLPMLIDGGEGSSLWRPFALTLVTGLTVSSILTLVIFPVMCVSFYKNKK